MYLEIVRHCKYHENEALKIVLKQKGKIINIEG